MAINIQYVEIPTKIFENIHTHKLVKITTITSNKYQQIDIIPLQEKNNLVIFQNMSSVTLVSNNLVTFENNIIYYIGLFLYDCYFRK